MIGWRSEPLRWAAAEAAGPGGDENRAAVLRTNDDIITRQSGVGDATSSH